MNESTYFDLFLNKYELERPLTVENRESGMNNTTRIVAAGDGRKYVLRIYNNHQDSNIVRLEHEVLKELSARPLPFRIPVPLPNKLGDTVSVAEDGKVSALFRYIEGKRPSAQVEAHIRALGKAAGELTAALGQIRPDSKPLYSPYFLLESTYEGMDCDAFTGLAERSEALAARRGSLLALQREREALQASTEGIRHLPQQWIHGDIVFNNTVAQEDVIVGVLDFEFCTVDARAMELAVIAADLVRTEHQASTSVRRIKLLLDGYGGAFRLTDEELAALPTLMKLRQLDVALHFACRYRDGLDGEEVLAGIIDQSAHCCNWVDHYWKDVVV